MKKIAVLSLALLLGACAHKPELAGTARSQAKHSYTKPAKIVQPAAPTEAKSATFKTRWFDRFMKHKSK